MDISSTAKNLICACILKDSFGPLVAEVAEILLKHERISLSQIQYHLSIQSTTNNTPKTSLTKIRQALVILYQHNCLIVDAPQEIISGKEFITSIDILEAYALKGLTYSLDGDMILNRLYFSKLLLRIRKIHGILGVIIMEQIIEHGKLNIGQLLKLVRKHLDGYKTMNEKPVTQSENEFQYIVSIMDTNTDMDIERILYEMAEKLIQDRYMIYASMNHVSLDKKIIQYGLNREDNTIEKTRGLKDLIGNTGNPSTHSNGIHSSNQSKITGKRTIAGTTTVTSSSTNKPIITRKKRKVGVSFSNSESADQDDHDLPLELNMISTTTTSSNHTNTNIYTDSSYDDNMIHQDHVMAKTTRSSTSSGRGGRGGRGRGQSRFGHIHTNTTTVTDTIDTGIMDESFLTNGNHHPSDSTTNTTTITNISTTNTAGGRSRGAMNSIASDVIWCIGWERYYQEVRHDICIQLIKDRMGSLASDIIKCMLKTSLIYELNRNQVTSKRMSLYEIFQEVNTFRRSQEIKASDSYTNLLTTNSTTTYTTNNNNTNITTSANGQLDDSSKPYFKPIQSMSTTSSSSSSSSTGNISGRATPRDTTIDINTMNQILEVMRLDCVHSIIKEDNTIASSSSSSSSGKVNGAHASSSSSSTSSTVYMVNIKSIMEYIKQHTLHSIVAERYNDSAGRIMELLQKKKFLEQQRIGDMVIVPPRDARADIYSLYKDGWVNVHEISKKADYNPSNTQYFWYADKQHLLSNLLNNMYKTLHNLMIRRYMEYEENKLLLEFPVTDERGVVQINQFIAKLNQLDYQQMKVYDTITLFIYL